MSEIKLASILTDEQLEAVLNIIHDHRTDSSTRILKLKQYLVQFREHLEANGVVPEYLTYVIEFQLGNIRQSTNPALN